MAEPVAVDGPLLAGVAAVGLLVNLIAAFLLHSHQHDSLNVRGAYLHVLGDLLGSVGALVAGAVVWMTGWGAADALVSVLIAALILVSAWRLVREATDVLLEAAPAHMDVERLPIFARCRGSTTSTTCTCGRSPAGSSRSPPTASSTIPASSAGCSTTSGSGRTGTASST